MVPDTGSKAAMTGQLLCRNQLTITMLTLSGLTATFTDGRAAVRSFSILLARVLNAPQDLLQNTIGTGAEASTIGWPASAVPSMRVDGGECSD